MSYEERIVEAIEDGKIVRVTENYARREGIPILRRPETLQQRTPLPPEKVKKIQAEFKTDLMDALKKKPSWKEKQVLSELVENFHWKIKTERMKRGLTRKQLASMLNEKEEKIKLIEYGTMPSEDFVLINKIQNVLKINLRKDGKDFSQSINDLMKKTEAESKRTFVLEQLKKQKEKSNSKSEIEILDNEI